MHWAPESRGRTASVALGLIGVIGFADYVTGYTLALSLFYLFPVLLATHVLGRMTGFALAGSAACVWTLAQWSGGFPANPLQIAWNLLMRFGILAVVTHLLLALETEMRQSRYDFLTNLINRRYFVRLLEAEQNRSSRNNTPFSVLYLDIDHFKTLNDTLGHAVGDEALQIVAEILRTQSRRMDAPARIGGDEFVMLLPDTNEADCRLITERIKQALAGKISQRRWPIGISIGIITVCGSEQTTEEILHAADQAMYRVKHASTGP
ncbi:MAG: GGDEF domain-containing protein [Candidatus Contendobacter sp.]|nr:GGDEF domain-containing protein [Candidatus Contendobacter sp.]MDG4556967.1 GGDEF domain-containing protein [Candidatus Contendobacter sp.]